MQRRFPSYKGTRWGGTGPEAPFQVRAYNRQFPGQKFPFDISKNPSERIFAGKNRPTKLHELYFGPTPPKTYDETYTTGWQTRNEWPYSHLQRNLIRVNRHIWAMARLLADQQWVNLIAPLVLTNRMVFNIQTKIYSDDMADFIGLSGPVTEVAMAFQEKMESVSYFGKGTSIHANMMSSPEGIKELWDKLLLVAMAVNRTELYDFILTVRGMKDAKLEAMKCPDEDMNKYYDHLKSYFDIVRKQENGLEQLCERVTLVSSEYHGKLQHMIVPLSMISKLIFKPEYTQYYKKGPSTQGLNSKINRPTATPDNMFDNVQKIEPIKGFMVHLIRRLMSTKYDLYRDVISRYTQIGTSHLLQLILDPNLSSPEKFRAEHLAMDIYDEDTDNKKRIDYDTCAKHSMTFDRNGKIRDLEHSSTYGYTRDKKHDLFLKPTIIDGGKKEYSESISLIGELNINRKKYQWDLILKFCAATMNNHFMRDDMKVTRQDIINFERLFTYLEEKPYDPTWLTELKNLNWSVTQVLTQATSKKRYSRAATFYKVKQDLNSGSYVLPPGRIGFGLANVWGVQAISKMAKENMNMKDQWAVDIANRFMDVFGMHIDSLAKQLPDNRLIGEEYEDFSHPIFDYPNPMYNAWINGVINTTNFLWFRWDPFRNTNTMTPVNENTPLYNFLKFISSNAVTPQGVETDLNTKFSLTNDQLTAGDPENIVREPPARFTNYIATGGVGANNQDDTRRDLITYLTTNGYYRAADVGELSGTQYNNYRIFSSVYAEGIGDDITVNDPYYPFLIYANASHKFLKGAMDTLIDADVITAYANIRNLSVEEFIRGVRRRHGGNPNIDRLERKYRIDMATLRRSYNIYKNSRDLATNLLELGPGTVKVQTTLTLSHQLLKNIMISGVSKDVNQTAYQAAESGARTGNWVLEETAGQIVDFAINDTRNDNTQRIKHTLTSDKPWWPHHIWYNMTLHQKIDQPMNLKSEKFGSLSIDNIAKFKKRGDGTMEVSHGNCLVSINSALRQNSNMFNRMNAILMCLSDCTRNNFIGMWKEDACPPVVYKVVRPHMEYKTHPIIFIGRGAVFRVRGNPLFMMGLNPSTAILRMRYAQSGGTIPVIYENVYIQENAIVISAQGGAGTIFYDPEQFSKMRKRYYDPDAGVFGNDGQCSLFAIEVPLGFWFFQKVNADITGHDQVFLKIGKNPNKIINEPPHYELSYRFQTFWKRNLSSIAHAQYEDTNTLVCVGRTWYCDSNGNFMKDIASQGHWGNEATFPGARQYRIGNTNTLPREMTF
jgi:hypothetical protein